MSDSLGAKLKSIFTEFDTNKEHVIPREKLIGILKGLDPSWTQGELDTLFEVADKDGNGVIDYNEFVDFVCFMDEDPAIQDVAIAGLQAMDAPQGLPIGQLVTPADTANVVAEIVAPLEAPVAGTEGEYTGPAPHMHEYFMKILKNTEEIMGKGIEFQMQVLGDPEFKAKFDKEQEAFYEELKGCIVKSFELHDSRKDNVLDKDEAALFFEHYASEQVLMNKAAFRIGTLQTIKMQMTMMAGMIDPSEIEAFKAETKQQVEQMMAMMDSQFEALEANYKANKAELDAAAFKITDTNGDGTLCLAEATAILTPGDPKNMEFITALGFMPQMVSR